MSQDARDFVDNVRHLLTEAFDPEHIEIADHTEAHRGHAEAKRRGGKHLDLLIVSGQFDRNAGARSSPGDLQGAR